MCRNVQSGRSKDGNPVSFLIHTKGDHTSILLYGKPVSFKNINISPNIAKMFKWYAHSVQDMDQSTVLSLTEQEN